MPRTRLDQLLVIRGLAESRARAQALIMAGAVRVDNQVQTRPGYAVSPESDVSIIAPLPYVSRGGFKLAHALDTFRLNPAGLMALDVGASTGGFTDVLLQRGARHVYAVDVGYGVLDWRLRRMHESRCWNVPTFAIWKLYHNQEQRRRTQTMPAYRCLMLILPGRRYNAPRSMSRLFRSASCYPLYNAW